MGQIERILSELTEIKNLQGKERKEMIRKAEKRRIEKRVRWFEENYPRLEANNLIRQAYLIFYLGYLELDETDGEIIEMNDTRLITHWRNDCPVLEACLTLGLETGEICQKIYEKPCQELLWKISPHLCFRRDYSRIRPYTDFCEEVIKLER